MGRPPSARTSIALVMALLLVSGCDLFSDAKKAAEAAGELSESAQQFAKAAEQAEKAGEAAGEEAQKQVDPSAAPEVQQQQVEMAKALGALGALGQHAQGEGPVANWRQLAPFLPDELGGFTAAGELDGKTQSMSNITVSHVSRRYEAEPQKATVKVTDTHFSSLLRAPFKMAALLKEDSSKGYKKGKEIAGHTAIVEWSEPRKTSKVMMLVAERYMLEVTVREASKPEVAEELVTKLDLSGLAKLEPKEE